MTMRGQQYRSPLRSRSFISPEVENPFCFEKRTPWYRVIQMVIMTITIVPLRLIAMGICLVLAWLVACIALAGLSEEDLAKEPLGGWRKQGRKGVHLIVHALCFFAGIICFRKGKQAPSSKAAALICTPHSSFVDAALICALDDIPWAVSRVENAQIPILGKLAKLSQPVFIYREDKNSRQNTILEIKRRAKSSGKWQQFIIFPEGTTTNRKALITFKPGAFIPGEPVQPVILRYPDAWDTVTWTWDGPGALLLLWMCMCKLYTRLEIEFLPVYTPNEAEKADANLFADNVRRILADKLQIPTTDHTYEDCRLLEFAKKANLRVGDGLVEFRKIQGKLGLKFEDLHRLLERFKVMSNLNENGGLVTLKTFSKYVGLPINEPLRELFALYDRDGSGHIDFREYVIGMSLISEPANADETIRLAFTLFDDGNKGYVTRTEFIQLLCDTLEASEEEAGALFDKVDSHHVGRVTFEDFKVYASAMPEYASLFTTYRRLRAAALETDSTNDLPVLGSVGREHPSENPIQPLPASFISHCSASSDDGKDGTERSPSHVDKKSKSE